MKTTVLYVGGSGRSGTTLIERVMGQLPGFVSVGEIRDIWHAGVGVDRLCGCGRPFIECPFWAAVGTEAFGGWAALATEAEGVRAYGYRQALPAILSERRLRPTPEVLSSIERLYGAIKSVSGGLTIIDSSKAATYGALLAGVAALDLRFLHVMRDSRGVAHSWAKRFRRADTTIERVDMPRISAARVAARWVVHNALSEMLARQVPSSRMRYETFLDDPRAQIRRVLGDLGFSVSESQLRFIAAASVRLSESHTASGNPMRMHTGEVALQRDDAWRHDLPARPRWTVGILTWPMLKRYGYPFRAEAGGGPPAGVDIESGGGGELDDHAHQQVGAKDSPE